MITEYEINGAYNQLAKTACQLFYATENALSLQQERSNTLVSAWFDGLVTGENQAEWEAMGRRRYPALFNDVDEAEREKRVAEHAHIIAKIEVERIRLLMRLNETVSS